MFPDTRIEFFAISNASTFNPAQRPCAEPVHKDVRFTGPCGEPVPGAGFFITQKVYDIFEKFQKDGLNYSKIYIGSEF